MDNSLSLSLSAHLILTLESGLVTDNRQVVDEDDDGGGGKPEPFIG